jgi:hypothetical protein
MGKNKKTFPKRNDEKSSNKPSFQEEEIKNLDDMSSENSEILPEILNNSKINIPTSEYSKTEEKYNNKFDVQFPEMNYHSMNLYSRKESKDSTNDSFSYEDYYENDFNYINNVQNNSKPKNIKNIFSQQNKPKNKIKGKFKSTATDFKIKYKTELCKYFEINGYCKYGDKCAYAHGKENLRSKVTNSTAYRTRKCVQFFENGYCPYGNRCQFAHQVKSNIINNPYDRKMTYKKTLETISKLENIENIKKLNEKPRLSIFKEICNNKKVIKNTLFDDIKKINKEDIIERIDFN